MKKSAAFLPLLFLFFCVKVALACSCRERPTVLESFEESDEVVVLKALSIEKIKEDEDEEVKYRYADGIKSTQMVVEKVYKGKLKVGDEITFGQGNGADCVYTFDEESIGEQFLFYLNRPKNDSKLWHTGTCGRSRHIAGADDDLLFLNNLDKVHGKTRISGAIKCWADGCPNVDNRKIKISGNNKTYEVKTDKKGIHEIYGLPAGEYSIEPEMPRGWKNNNFWLRYSPSFIGFPSPPSRRPKHKQFLIDLKDKKHASLDFHLEIDSEIQGIIFDPNGKPMESICIRAVSTKLSLGDYRGPTGCTDENGSFTIDTIYPGNYILVVNDDGKIGSRYPFGTVFYPGVVEREKAGVISIEAGGLLKNINVQIPWFEDVITVEGKLLFADGKPIANKNIRFIPENDSGGKLDDFRVNTDEQGNFSIRILKGLTGELFGEMTIYKSDYENCPETAKLIKVEGQKTWEDVKTEALNFTAEKNLYNIELKIRFPSCKKSKE
ncbi:MAG: carboxypeptidase regulatory-like domain-containing protein [Acidobacteriota bacterium]|nr:carboxypeptidase regulatory-like domain-containing protein [Acidobacteriota bacterium]